MVEETQPQLVDELQQYQSQIAAIESELSLLTDGLTEGQLSWRPAQGAWSILECLSHLNLFGSQVEENIMAMIREARAAGLYGDGPYRHAGLGRLLLRSVEPPYRIRFKAVKRLVPPTIAEPSDRVVAEFLGLQGRFRALLQLATGLDLGGVRRPVPPTNLPITLGQWFALGLAHERRHLWQAKQIRLHPGFPK